MVGDCNVQFGYGKARDPVINPPSMRAGALQLELLG